MMFSCAVHHEGPTVVAIVGSVGYGRDLLLLLPLMIWVPYFLFCVLFGWSYDAATTRTEGRGKEGQEEVDNEIEEGGFETSAHVKPMMCTYPSGPKRKKNL